MATLWQIDCSVDNLERETDLWRVIQIDAVGMEIVCWYSFILV